MHYILLLDAAPEPVSVGVGIAGLILIGIVALMITAAVLVGFVFLFKRLKGKGGSTRLMVGDICLNLGNAASQSNAQPQSNPNQS